MTNEGTVTLRDGRTLAYAEFGDAGGAPAFYFHGTPGSRLEAEHFHAAAVVSRIRVIGVDRPGFGKSDFLKKRQFRDWPDDVTELAAALGIDRFAVIGLSGGGPHVASCVLRMPERLTAACVVSGATPKEARLATARSWWRRLWYRWNFAVTPIFARPATAWMAYWTPRIPASRMPKFVDKRVMSRPRLRELFKRELTEAFRNGSKGTAHEYRLHARPWQMDVRTMTTPVHLWHGDADTIVKFETAQWLAAQIPDCRATWLPGEGHLLFVDHAAEVMQIVADASRKE